MYIWVCYYNQQLFHNIPDHLFHSLLECETFLVTTPLFVLSRFSPHTREISHALCTDICTTHNACTIGERTHTRTHARMHAREHETWYHGYAHTQIHTQIDTAVASYEYTNAVNIDMAEHCSNGKWRVAKAPVHNQKITIFTTLCYSMFENLPDTGM